MSAEWPWLTAAGLGAFHGLNPAMGWLFAVALGLHRGSRRVVLGSLAPIALGHLVAIGGVAAALLAIEPFLPQDLLRRIAGALLVLWALWHWAYGSRHRVRFGMTTGAIGLAIWSFLMASTHGAGFMLLPALIPLCGGAAGGSPLTAAAAVAVHAGAMLAVAGTIAVVIYEWVGVDFLRRGWLNLDQIWSAALVTTGVVLLV